LQSRASDVIFKIRKATFFDVFGRFGELVVEAAQDRHTQAPVVDQAEYAGQHFCYLLIN